jgi:hypothetical protein
MIIFSATYSAEMELISYETKLQIHGYYEEIFSPITASKEHTLQQRVYSLIRMYASIEATVSFLTIL